MDEEQFEEIFLFFFFVIFMDEDKKKKEKKPTTWVRGIFKERNQEGTYNNLIQEMRLRDKCFSGNTINYINIIMHALSDNIERLGAKGVIYFEVYVTSPVLRRCR